MSPLHARLDRFIRWFFCSSPTTVFDHRVHEVVGSRPAAAAKALR